MDILEEVFCGYEHPIHENMLFSELENLLDHFLLKFNTRVRDSATRKLLTTRLEYLTLVSNAPTCAQKIKLIQRLDFSSKYGSYFFSYDRFTPEQRERLAPKVTEIFNYCANKLKNSAGSSTRIKICTIYMLDGFEYKDSFSLEERAVLINNILRLSKSEDAVKRHFSLLDRTKEFIATKVISDNIVLADFSIVERCLVIAEMYLIDNHGILRIAIDNNIEGIVTKLNREHESRIQSILDIKRL